MITAPDLAAAELCAKGPKQLELVRELAEGPVIVRQDSTVQAGYQRYVVLFGLCQLPYSSFRGLRDRLKRAGFQMKAEYPTPQKHGTIEVWR